MAKPIWLGRNEIESRQEGRKILRCYNPNFFINHSSFHGFKIRKAGRQEKM
jgi:hypothetical protein